MQSKKYRKVNWVEKSLSHVFYQTSVFKLSLSAGWVVFTPVKEAVACSFHICVFGNDLD
jgi:hypothetical protein